MTLTVLALASFLLAALPALVFFRNLSLYLPPPYPPRDAPEKTVSVLIPARNEAATIAGAVGSALASQGVRLEVFVYDDGSEDDTPRIVSQLSESDPRVHFIRGNGLPAGWSGKQHACARLAEAATGEILVFLDADVRLAPDGLARAAEFLRESQAALVSGIPRQLTNTFSERLVIPLIHFILLGFLPFWRMRRSTHSSYAAGCGQLFVTRRDAYIQAGGHSSIRETWHDGIMLPRAYRARGLRTDLFDATDIAECRMYRGMRELWEGLSKNATEGLATPGKIVPATVLLLGGHVLPYLILFAGELHRGAATSLALSAAVLAYLPRFLAARPFRQSWLGAVFHPLGVALLVAIQWYSLFRSALGVRPRWKERVYPG